MADEYVKVGQNKTFLLLIQNKTTLLPDTAAVGGDFTLKLSKNLVGNQATTGCTFGVVDTTNNPGIIYLDCSGSTSFLSATGQYGLEVYTTADQSRIWTETVVVTNDGTGAGLWGAASFTPTAANGRIVAASVALQGATVRITNSSGVLIYQVTSDASGLYTTLYFDTAGTYTINVSKSGYTVATGSIVVVGSVATGPGTDLSITLSTTTSGLLASDLWAYARRQLTDNTGSKADTEVREIVDESLAYLAMVKQWPYLQARGVINTVASYSIGTVAITNGLSILTLTGGTWPTWAASGAVYINNSWVTVSTRDSATQLTINGAYGEQTETAASFIISQHAYTLPTDLMRITGVYFGQNWPYTVEVSSAKLDMYRDLWQTGNAFPYCWAITASQFMVWPYPSTTHRVNLLYYKRPALLVSASDTADWDPLHLLVLHRSIDYHASLRGEIVAGTSREARANLEDAIALAWEWDKTGDLRELTGANGVPYNDDYLRGSVT